MRWPSGLPMSTASDCLLRAVTRHQRPSPFLNMPVLRTSSPRGCSILTTSAPRSASSVPTSGPAKMTPASMTRRPSSGPAALRLGLLLGHGVAHRHRRSLSSSRFLTLGCRQPPGRVRLIAGWRAAERAGARRHAADPRQRDKHEQPDDDGDRALPEYRGSPRPIHSPSRRCFSISGPSTRPITSGASWNSSLRRK